MRVITEELLFRRHRVTVREYYRMAELGILAPDTRIELVAGEVIDMTPTGPHQGGNTNFLDYALKHAVGDRALVRVQLPVQLDEHNEPEPDLAVVKPRTDFYKNAHPVVADVMLLVEVSDSTLRYDREVKIPLYAMHGVPEVWIVDLKAESMHIFRSAEAGQYTEVSSTRVPAAMPIVTLPGVTVDLGQLFRR